MKKMSLVGFALFVCLAPMSAGGADFDGSRPLLCALVDIMECDPGVGCKEVTAESINAPGFLKINFKDKQISATRETGTQRVTPIKGMGHLDGKLVLQGMDEGVEGERGGLAWSLAISEDTGKMILTASGEQVGFVVFGGCTTF